MKDIADMKNECSKSIDTVKGKPFLDGSWFKIIPEKSHLKGTMVAN